jgi:molybdate transport system substrate-binding protein
MRIGTVLIATALATMTMQSAGAAEIKVLTAGAFKQVLLALVPEYEQQTGNKVVIENDTVVVSPLAVADLTKQGKVAPGTSANLARVGVGVVVKQGAPHPDISTVEAFKHALLTAKSVAYIDPASGGSSGIFVDRLLDKLGIAGEVRPKAKLIEGGAVADHIANGEAELGVHQISEIMPVKGVELVGPLPGDLQNYTVYAAGVSATSKNPDAAAALIKLLSGADAAAVLKAKGMEPPA